MRADARVCALVLACVLGSGCAWFTRPDGDGGWDAERRREEMARRQSAAASPATSVSTAPDAGATPDVAEPIPGRDPSRPMDLADALVLASRGNRRIAEARQQLLASAERVADVRGRFLPSTAAQARYTLYSSSQTTNVEFPDGLLPPGVPKPDVVVREADVGTVNATVYFPLDFTGELRHTLEAAQAGYRGERARVWATTLDEQLAVVQGYFQLLEARRLRAVTEQTIAVYRTQVGITQARFDQERLTKNDLLTVQVALLTAEQSLLARDLAIEQARWSFNQVVGVAVNDPAELADVSVPPEIPTVEDALARTYAHNPILLSLVEEQQRLEATAVALERSRLPRFGAGGGVDYSSMDILTPQQIGSGFAGFTWDLGTDTRREAQIAEARVLAEKNRLATERQLRDLEAAVRAAQLATAERLAAYATARHALGQAEENLRIREQQFDVGRAQSDDVLIAERLLAEQRATLATALYQAHTRRAALQRLMGQPIDDLIASNRG
ncbi:MAG: TolC family protein [Deltaproteobacteria bacterium]|nr:TolC family protein [Deltaproteobacteria bacterium]